MGRDRIFLSSPHMSDDGIEQAYVKEAFDTNWIAPLGANVIGFEQDIKKFTEANAVTALSAGTAALHLAMILAQIGRDDLVFCQTLTFSASVNPVAYLGGKIVFIDSERDTWNLDPDLLEEAVAKHGVPKALVVVHLYGMPAKMDQIIAFCDKYNVILIEDAAEAFGSTYSNQACGTFGDFGVLSFNGNKIITTSGGGTLLCKREEDAAHALKLATQAREDFPWYQHEEVGYNYRMSNICAGIGRGQMTVLSHRVEKKRQIHAFYQAQLSQFPVTFLEEAEDVCSNRWLSVILLPENSKVSQTEMIEALGKENIEARHLWKPMHLQPVFAGCAFVGTSVSEDLFNRGICLPSDSKMTEVQQMEVCNIIKGLF